MTRTLILMMAVACLAGAAPAPAKLTLDQAIDLALRNNRALAIASAQTDEMKAVRKIAGSSYFPQISTSASYLRLTETDVLQFAQGSFGTFPNLGSLPSSQLTVKQGDLNQVLIRNQVVQPLTQLFRIREGDRVARADEAASVARLDGLRNQVSLKVRQLYYALIAAQLDRALALEQVQFTTEEAAESEQDVLRGAALEISLTEARTRLLQARQDELNARIRQQDLFAQFDDLVGLPPGTSVEVDPRISAPLDVPGREECMHLAEAATPEIAEAEQMVGKAKAAVRASQYEYIPDLAVFARHDYQDGVAFLFHNYGVVGAEFSFKIFDGGKRRAEIAQHQAQYRQAVQNLARLKEAAEANVQLALDKIEQSRSLTDLAQQVADLRAEALRIASVQLTQSAVLPSKVTEAKVALSKARADLVKAQLANEQAQAELQVTIGRLPR
jgi:outer membrane protein TolC